MRAAACVVAIGLSSTTFTAVFGAPSPNPTPSPPKPSPLAHLPPPSPHLAGTTAATVHEQVVAAQRLLASGSIEPAYAILAELARTANCGACNDAVEATRFDDAWRLQWDDPRFVAVLDARDETNTRDVGPIHDDPNANALEKPALTCPTGTKQSGTWKPGDGGEVWCAKSNGVRHGPYEDYESGYSMGEGTRTVSGMYRDGVKHGHWSETASYSESPDGDYVNGLREGLFRISHKEKLRFVRYVADQQQGTSTTWGDSNHILEEKHFDHDKLDGAYRAWSENTGALAEAGAYAHGDKIGTWMTWDDNRGLLTSEGWDHGLRWGTFETWDGKGKQLSKVVLDHGNGQWVERANDGTVVAEGPIVAGVWNGAWTEHTGSSTIEKGMYKAGVRVGVWIASDPTDGHELREGPYVAGKRSGAWKFLHADGTLAATGAFVKDDPSGTWIVYDDDGKTVTQTLVFRAGKLVTVDGKRASKGLLNGYRLAASTGFSETPVVIQPTADGDMGPFAP